MALQSDPAASRPRRTAMSPASNVEKAWEARKSCWAFRVAQNFLPGSPQHVCVLTGGVCVHKGGRAAVCTRVQASRTHTRVLAEEGAGRERGARSSPKTEDSEEHPATLGHPGTKHRLSLLGRAGGKKKELFLLLEQTLGLAEGWMGTACAGRRAHSQHPGPQMLRSVSSRLCRRLDFSRPAESHPTSPK